MGDYATPETTPKMGLIEREYDRGFGDCSDMQKGTFQKKKRKTHRQEQVPPVRV
jgi:hypothetical protein